MPGHDAVRSRLLPYPGGNAVLSPYRVLDLTDERGLLAGKMLADLGADVIQVEPPGGSSARRVPPLFDAEGIAACDRSAYWAAYAAGKRGITCDIDRPEGQALVRRLAATADFLFESDAPGAMAARGLGFADLCAVNPALIHVSITPFGQDGPKAGYADSEIVLWAAGGALAGARDGDRPPLRISAPQAYLHAAGDAASGAMVAHFARVRSGTGQHVDISVQQSVAQATLSTILAHAVGQTVDPPRSPTAAAGTKWQVRDGLVELVLAGGVAMGHFTNNLFRWLHEEGGCDAETAALDWRRMPDLIASGAITNDDITHIRAVVADFLAERTKGELIQQAARRKFMLAPVFTTADLAASPHLAERGFWQAVEGAPVPGLRYPGLPEKISGHDFPLRRPAPRLGEHNHEVYVDDLGLSEADLARLRDKGVI
jgi:crotonobetainyl-CoA:carnitine CoA-transferase CaiB-like acyl-CoA transferase